MPSRPDARLLQRIQEIEREAGARHLAAAFYDYETRTRWSYRGDRWFHAASTIKVPVLAAVMGAVHHGRLSLDSRVHVRNWFLSAADGQPFRLSNARDANAEVHTHLGRTMRVDELAFHMIVTSSNLATNLLLEVVGLEDAQRSIAELGVGGLELRRGVEDEAAFERGINNRVTADGMLGLLRLIEEGRAYSVELSARMLEILHDQEFRSGIPAGVPEGAKVANKTGEISTIAHDAALVYLPGRKPYALVVLTEWDPKDGRRSETIASVSRAVFQHLTGEGADG